MEQAFGNLSLSKGFSELHGAVEEMPEPVYSSDVFTKRLDLREKTLAAFMKAMQRFRDSGERYLKAYSNVETIAADLSTCNAQINDTENKRTGIENGLANGRVEYTKRIQDIRENLKRKRDILVENRSLLKANLEQELQKMQTFKRVRHDAFENIQELQATLKKNPVTLPETGLAKQLKGDDQSIETEDSKEEDVFYDTDSEHSMTDSEDNVSMNSDESSVSMDDAGKMVVRNMGNNKAAGIVTEKVRDEKKNYYKRAVPSR